MNHCHVCTYGRIERGDPGFHHSCLPNSPSGGRFYAPLFLHPFRGIRVLAYREHEVVGHAVATTRWLQPEGLPLLRTAYVDAVAPLPAYQGQGIASTVMRRLATVIADFELACLATEHVSFYARLGWEVWREPLAGRRASGPCALDIASLVQ